jgi:hypothetical protein
MSWKEILKQSALKEVKQILDFVKNDMRRELGEPDMNEVYETKELTEEIASDILYLLKEGKSSPTKQIFDEMGGTTVDVYIDDGFSFRITADPKEYPYSAEYFGDEEFGFGYDVQHNLYERLREGKTTPEKVEAIIDKFLAMIGRTGMEHGLSVENLGG